MVAVKRKATDTSDGVSTSKKARAITHQDAQALVKAILTRPDTYPILDDPAAVRRQFVELARYARDLEQGSSSMSEKTMAPGQLQSAVEKLRKAANSGIKKQMAWKSSCKTGSAKWCYDGVCTDPLVFGTLMGEGGPPKFKARKVTVDEFENLLGTIQASVRHDNLYITGPHVNVRWSESGEFKFSGTYGKIQP